MVVRKIQTIQKNTKKNTKKLKELSGLTSTNTYFSNALQITVTYFKMGSVVLEVFLGRVKMRVSSMKI